MAKEEEMEGQKIGKLGVARNCPQRGIEKLQD